MAPSFTSRHEPVDQERDSNTQRAIRNVAEELQKMKQQWKWQRDWYDMFRGQTWPIKILLQEQEEQAQEVRKRNNQNPLDPRTRKRNYFEITGFKENGASIFEGHMTRNHTMFVSSVQEPTFFGV